MTSKHCLPIRYKLGSCVLVLLKHQQVFSFKVFIKVNGVYYPIPFEHTQFSSTAWMIM